MHPFCFSVNIQNPTCFLDFYVSVLGESCDQHKNKKVCRLKIKTFPDDSERLFLKECTHVSQCIKQQSILLVGTGIRVRAHSREG